MPAGLGYEPMPGGPPPNLLQAAPPQPQAPAPQGVPAGNGVMRIDNPDGSVTFSLSAPNSGVPGKKTRGHGGYRTERHDYFAAREAARQEAVELREFLNPYTRPINFGGRGRKVKDEDPAGQPLPLVQNAPPQIARRAQNRRSSDLSRFIHRV